MAIPARANTNAELMATLSEFGFNDGSDNKIGDLDDSGLQLDFETGENEVVSGSQRETYVYLKTNSSIQLAGNLLNVNVNNVAFALGLDEDAQNITGTGTAGDPYILEIDVERLGEQVQRTYYANGAREDGDQVRLLCTARIFAPNVSMTFVEGTPAVVPFQLRVNATAAAPQAFQIQTWTPA